MWLPVQWVMSVDNFVDSLWKERPALPLEPIEVHEDCFSGRASSLKRIEISKTLETRGIKAFLLTTGDSISWLLNIRGGDIQDTPVPFSYAFLQNDASVDFFVDKKKISASVADFLGSSVRIHPLDAIEDFFTNMENIGLDPSVTPKAMVEKLGEGAWIPMDDPCRLPKACKNETEQQGAIDCHKVDGLAVTKFLYWVEQQEALTEIEASEKLASFRATGLHYKGPSFETISAVGPNGMLCHYRPKNKSRSFQKGDIYLVDSGGQYLNGTTDITRTVIWKGTPTKLQKLHYTLVLKGHIALATARFPKGTTGVQLDVLARQYLWQHGLDYSHGTGHGVGSYLSVHEAPPSISPRAGNTPLCAGMVISNEPGYYLKDHYGIRLENLVLVKESKDLTDFLEFETITLAPFDRRLMDETMLSDAEKTWLKSYHQRILDTFKDTLTEEEQAWVFEHSF
jgi:Xaa-Pro aminopeptidase